MLVSCHEAALLSFREDVFACQLTGSPHWRANWWGAVVKECEREGARWSGWRGVTCWHFCHSDEKIDRRILVLSRSSPKMQKARRLKKRYRVCWVHKWNLPLKTCFLAFSKSKKALESGIPLGRPRLNWTRSQRRCRLLCVEATEQVNAAIGA